jgi:cationic amino acid transporter 4
MAAILTKIGNTLNRRKILEPDIMETPLNRCLNTFDLTMLGIGHMVGAGIFVLTGTVVRDVAGPGTILSYFFAGIAALLSALCYAEFGARVPKAGSAYTYTYVTIGEFWAFIIGWNIILEHLLGTASVARAFSGSFDSIFNGAIRNGTLDYIGSIHAPFISTYPDFVAFLVTLLVMAFVASGAKASINFNSILTIVNLVAILLIILVGFALADTKNWSNPDKGGFLPYGFQGVFAGAATCFYAYIGFEGIAVAGEEAKNPAKSIPIATCISMAVVTVLYMFSSSALTLMIPYDAVDLAAPFPHAFMMRGARWAQFIVAFGALFGIITSLTGSLFSLPRAIYAMAADGLIFRCFAYIHPKTQTPLVGVLSFGLIAAFLSLLIEIDVLVEFLSIGTLLSFTMVSASVIILRYQPASKCQFALKPEPIPEEYGQETNDKQQLNPSQSHDDIGKLKKRFQTIPVLKDMQPETTTTASVIVMVCFMIAWCCLLVFGSEEVAAATWWALLLFIILLGGMVACFSVLLMHEQNTSFMTFQIPFVPFLPSLSMLLNILFMLKLNYLTWIRLAVWLFLGCIIYFIYGIRYSKENKPLSAYSHVISYGGDAETVVPYMEEKTTLQQPQPGEDNETAEESSDSEYGRDYARYKEEGGIYQ